MIHHLSFGTDDLARARAFYDPVLAVVGLRLMNEDEQSIDYGAGTLLFSLERPLNGQPATPGNGAHVAFSVERRTMVDEFYRVALAQGGRDAGPPGLRPEYDANYYGAFVFDPDGNKIEAVTFSSK
ncbi:VOC family protein [Aquabacter sp. CN5-332]|uniref:VOC family protein n=1 Tax=Aquabacter sp. CN5-332 TaxID=3156608 RepID=UPI0032B34367